MRRLIICVAFSEDTAAAEDVSAEDVAADVAAVETVSNTKQTKGARIFSAHPFYIFFLFFCNLY